MTYELRNTVHAANLQAVQQAAIEIFGLCEVEEKEGYSEYCVVLTPDAYATYRMSRPDLVQVTVPEEVTLKIEQLLDTPSVEEYFKKGAIFLFLDYKFDYIIVTEGSKEVSSGTKVITIRKESGNWKTLYFTGTEAQKILFESSKGSNIQDALDKKKVEDDAGRKKVLCVHPSSELGGTLIHFDFFKKASGHKFTLGSWEDENITTDTRLKLSERGIYTIIPFGKSAERLRKFVIEKDIDVVIFTGPLSLQLMLGDIPSVKVIYMFVSEGIWSESSLQYANDLDGIICISKHLHKLLEERLSVTIEPEIVVNAVDDYGYANPMSISSQKKYIRYGFLGSFQKRKNVPELLRAFDKVARTDDTLNIFGHYTGSEAEREVERDFIYSALQGMYNDHRRKVKIFEGETSIPRIFGSMDVLVSPSMHEGMSQAALEAMMFGIPVIMRKTEYKFGFFSQYFGEESLLFYETEKELIKCMRKVRDIEVRDALARNARKIVGTNHSLKRMGRDLDAIINGVCND